LEAPDVEEHHHLPLLDKIPQPRAEWPRLKESCQGWARFPYPLEECIRGKVLENEMLKRVSAMPNGGSIRDIGGQLYVANPRYTVISTCTPIHFGLLDFDHLFSQPKFCRLLDLKTSPKH
jgi:hypothetical protein